MYNWSVDLKQLKKSPRAYAVWQLEQMINFGLNGKKIKEKALRANWAKLKLDPARKNFLKLLLNK